MDKLLNENHECALLSDSEDFDDCDYRKVEELGYHKGPTSIPDKIKYKKSDYYLNGMERYSSKPSDAFPFKFKDDIAEEEELMVYPLSVKYNPSTDTHVKTIRFILLIGILVLFGLFVLLSLLTVAQTFSVRLGYFSDKITTEEFTLADLNEIAVNTQNCITYLLESKGASDKVEVYVSADRSSGIDISLDGSILNVKVTADVLAVQ
jgi:hypothetical protein